MRCKICGNEVNNREYKVQEMMFGYKDVFYYFQCSKCNCLQIKEFPLDMSKYYPDDYYSYQPISKSTIRVKRFLVNLRDKYAVFNEGLIGKLLYIKYPNTALRSLLPLQLSKDSHILDVGCGAGFLLNSLHELGFKNLLGIDPYNEKDVGNEDVLRIQNKSIEEVDGKWDLIMYHHSFEHVPNPKKTLESTFDLLNAEGCCIIRMPTVSSYAWKHYGINWVQLDAPRHFFLHSLDSMKILSSETGFEIYNIVYDSTSFQFWGSEQYIKNVSLHDKQSYGKNPKNSIFSKEEIEDFTKRSEELNAAKQGDSATFYLRKI